MPDVRRVDDATAFVALGSADRVWARAAAIHRSGAWQASSLDLVTGCPPPDWRPEVWRYDEVVFVAEETDGAAAGSWLKSGSAELAGLVIRLPDVHPTLSCHHLSSLQRYTYAPLAWPCLAYELGQWTDNQNPPEPLIGPGVPSFGRYAQAASAFFGIEFGMGGVTDRPAYLRVQDLTGRIVGVQVAAAELSVVLEGSALRGAVLELASDVPGPCTTIEQERASKITFPLAEDPLSNGWVVLKRDSEWIDRKHLRSNYTNSADSGVDYVVEPATQIQSIISQGETTTVEFKSRMPEPAGKDKKYREEIAGTIAAFANQSGGWLLLGVANNGTIEGLTLPGSIDQAKISIVNLIKDLVTPLVDFDIDCLDIDGSIVMIVTVSQGATPPYGVDHRNPRYYIRRGGTTFPATPEAIRQLARARPPLEHLGHRGYPY